MNIGFLKRFKMRVEFVIYRLVYDSFLFDGYTTVSHATYIDHINRYLCSNINVNSLGSQSEAGYCILSREYRRWVDL